MEKEEKKQKSPKRQDTTATLRDMDKAVKKYIEEEIIPAYELHEKDTGKKAQVLIKNPEKITKQGEYDFKDDLGEKYNFPIIAIERLGVDIIGGSVPNWLPDDMVNYLLNTENKFSYSEENNQDHYMVRRPSYVQGQYSVEIFTDFMDDNNIITEQFIMHENKYWKKDGHVMQASYTSINNNYTRDDMGSERTIVGSLNLMLTGFILPKYISHYKSPVNVIPSTVGVKFNVKRVKLN